MSQETFLQDHVGPLIRLISGSNCSHLKYLAFLSLGSDDTPCYLPLWLHFVSSESQKCQAGLLNLAMSGPSSLIFMGCFPGPDASLLWQEILYKLLALDDLSSLPTAEMLYPKTMWNSSHLGGLWKCFRVKGTELFDSQ